MWIGFDMTMFIHLHTCLLHRVSPGRLLELLPQKPDEEKAEMQPLPACTQKGVATHLHEMSLNMKVFSKTGNTI